MIGNSFTFGISQSHAYTGVWNTASTIYYRIIFLSHFETGSEPYLFYVSAFVARSGKTIIYP
ncbi:Uncharacterised protein [Bacteroides heparinolyticus]|uniref:Uncharacterized protein n=1 Tax=Prevotella heparinolytica TaxID=28113 RepID=A0A449I0A9_9BACE|nr:Uncharacterised protein [Bacteroides heparinolyticus]